MPSGPKLTRSISMEAQEKQIQEYLRNQKKVMNCPRCGKQIHIQHKMTKVKCSNCQALFQRNFKKKG